MAQYCVNAWHYSALVWRNTVSMLGTIVRQYSAILCPCLALKCASIAQCSYYH